MCRFMTAPNFLQSFTICINGFIISQSAAASEVVNLTQANRYLPQLLLINQLLEMVVVDGGTGRGGHAHKNIASVHA